MTTKSAVQFLQSVWSNEALKDRVQDQTDLAGIIAIASESGYEFTEDEFHQAQLEVSDRYDIELGEEALEAVAGGVCSSSYFCCSCDEVQ